MGKNVAGSVAPGMAVRKDAARQAVLLLVSTLSTLKPFIDLFLAQLHTAKVFVEKVFHFLS